MARKQPILYPREVEVTPTKDLRTFIVEFSPTESIRARTVSLKQDLVTVFPFDREGRQRYKTIECISFEGYSRKIPSGFHTTSTYGYGPTRTLAPLFSAIQEEVNVTEVRISKTGATALNGNCLTISSKEIDAAFPIFSALNREHREDLEHASKATLHKLLPKVFADSVRKYIGGGLAAYVKSHQVADGKLSAPDVGALVSLLKGKTQLDPSQILSAKQVIEEFYIEDVLAEFEALLKRKGAGKLEEEWQKFFKKYSWIFGQLFSSPVMLFQDKAYVGGKGIEDSDGKIADFLYQNNLTMNVAIIEIKTHLTDLLRSTPYRGKDVFAESEDLSGAKAQVLNQRDNLQKEYYELSKKSSRPFETHNTSCVVLAGQVRSLKKQQVSSFELHRNNSKDIYIVTFDEVLERLKVLQKVIRGESLGGPKKKSGSGKPPARQARAKA